MSSLFSSTKQWGTFLFASRRAILSHTPLIAAIQLPAKHNCAMDNSDLLLINGSGSRGCETRNLWMIDCSNSARYLIARTQHSLLFSYPCNTTSPSRKNTISAPLLISLNMLCPNWVISIITDERGIEYRHSPWRALTHRKDTVCNHPSRSVHWRTEFRLPFNYPRSTTTPGPNCNKNLILYLSFYQDSYRQSSR